MADQYKKYKRDIFWTVGCFFIKQNIELDSPVFQVIFRRAKANGKVLPHTVTRIFY